MSEKTVVVAGAGPAGALLATRLGSSGLRVLLFDPLAPWEKPCGGMLTPGTLREHPVMRGYPYALSLHRSIVFESSRGARKRVSTKQPMPVVSRRDLGRFLLDAAVSSGAEFHSLRVRSVSRYRSRWIVETDERLYEADLLVGADGVTGIVRKMILGRFPKKHLGQTCGYLLKGLPERQCLIKFLDIEGYLWVFPRQELASVGIAAALGSLPGKSLFNMLDRFLSERYPRAHVFHKYSALIPLAAGESFFRQPACGSDWLLVGDAAGHVDPLLGEGISFALKSAECAAQAILSGNIPTYEALWRERYGNMLADRASVRRTLSVLGRALAMEVLAEMVFQSIAA